MSRRLICIAAVTPLLTVGACGDVAHSEALPTELAHDLPYDQSTVAQELCTASSGVSGRPAARPLAVGVGQIRPLERALAVSPHAEVRRGATDAEGPGQIVEVMTILQFAETHSDGLDGGAGIRGAKCVQRNRQPFQAAVGASD